MADLRHPPEPLPRRAGWAALGVLIVFLAAGLARHVPDDAPLAAFAVVLAVGSGAAATLAPQRYVLPAAALATAGVAVLCNGTSSSVGWFALPVLAGWVTLSAPLLAGGVYWLGAVATLVVELIVTPDPGWAAWIGGTTFSVVGCLFARRQKDLLAQLREAQAGLAQRAQAEERNRIARELHDVIAHSLTVSLLHVSSARLALADDPADAARALAEAERLGRDSLDEVRHAVGLLRSPDGADPTDPTAPLPGSLDIAALIERSRSAGLDLHAELDGPLDTLPATVGLAVYRILQESLTNAAKHAPAARVTARVRVTGTEACVDVDSAGLPGTGAGLGLLGIRERAAALGGTASAGAGGSGWLVHATLPLAVARR